MACYSLDFLIISEDTTKVDTQTASLATAKDEKVLESLYEVSDKRAVDIGDSKTDYSKGGNIRYKDESERDKAYEEMVTSIKAAAGIKAGSFVQKHTCYHDEKPTKPCIVTDRYEVK